MAEVPLSLLQGTLTSITYIAQCSWLGGQTDKKCPKMCKKWTKLPKIYASMATQGPHDAWTGDSDLAGGCHMYVPLILTRLDLLDLENQS